MDERSVDTLSQKLTVPLQLQLDSVSDGLKEEYRNLLGSLRDDLYSLKMETAGFHGTLDQRLVNALRTLFNEVSDETINNTIHPNNLDDTMHPTNHPVVNWIISGIWFWLVFPSKFKKTMNFRNFSMIDYKSVDSNIWIKKNFFII